MNDSKFIEKLPLSVIAGGHGRYSAIILNTTGNKSILQSLGELYPQADYKVGTTDIAKDEVNEALALCSSTGAIVIVLGDDAAPDTRGVTPATGFSACLISSGGDKGINGNVLGKMLKNEMLNDFSLIAFQQYKLNPSIPVTMREKFFESIRLGVLRENVEMAEPLMRDKEYLFFDLNSVRYSDFPENLEQSPNGLYAEEACQLGRYAGMNQKLRVCSIYGFNPSSSPGSPSSQLVAEIIWHILEGKSASANEDPSSKSKEEYFLRKIVSMGDDGQDMIFVTSNISGRWWMEIPDFKNNCSRFVACSLSDYQSAYNGEVPLRWIFFFQKINPN